MISLYLLSCCALEWVCGVHGMQYYADVLFLSFCVPCLDFIICIKWSVLTLIVEIHTVEMTTIIICLSGSVFV